MNCDALVFSLMVAGLRPWVCHGISGLRFASALMLLSGLALAFDTHEMTCGPATRNGNVIIYFDYQTPEGPGQTRIMINGITKGMDRFTKCRTILKTVKNNLPQPFYAVEENANTFSIGTNNIPIDTKDFYIMKDVRVYDSTGESMTVTAHAPPGESTAAQLTPNGDIDAIPPAGTDLQASVSTNNSSCTYSRMTDGSTTASAFINQLAQSCNFTLPSTDGISHKVIGLQTPFWNGPTVVTLNDGFTSIAGLGVLTSFTTFPPPPSPAPQVTSPPNDSTISPSDSVCIDLLANQAATAEFIFGNLNPEATPLAEYQTVSVSPALLCLPLPSNSIGATNVTVNVYSLGATGRLYGAQSTVAYAIAAATLSLACPAQTTAAVGSSFSSPFVATGGSGPYLYSVPNGYTLPTGLNLAPTSGLVFGPLTTSGGFTYRGQVTSGSQTALSPACILMVE